VLGSIVFGLSTPTEAAAVGAFGGCILAVIYRYITHWQAAKAAQGAGEGIAWKTLKELGVIVKDSSFLTAKTSAMVCWLFIGSAILLRGVRAAWRAGGGRALGAVARPHAAAVS